MNQTDQNLVHKIPFKYLDGTEKELLCCFGTFIIFQELSGKDPWDRAQMDAMTPKDYVHLVAAAIYQDEAKDHLNEVRKNINMFQVPEIQKFARLLYGNTMTDKDEKKTESEKSQEKSENQTKK